MKGDKIKRFLCFQEKALIKGDEEMRMDALKMLLTEAKDGLKNTYEMMWLKYRIRDTEEKLKDN